LADELELFAYGYACEHKPQGYKQCQKCGEIAVKSRNVGDIIYSLATPRYNYGAPRIAIINVNGDGSLLLEHEHNDLGVLNHRYAEKTLEYVYELWKKPVHLKTFNSEDETTTLMYTASGMEVGK
jgi:stage V sporulation protein R